MFACSITVRCPSDKMGSYYHLYFQKNKQWRARRAISIPSFNHVSLPMSACVLVMMQDREGGGGQTLGGQQERERIEPGVCEVGNSTE